MDKYVKLAVLMNNDTVDIIVLPASFDIAQVLNDQQVQDLIQHDKMASTLTAVVRLNT